MAVIAVELILAALAFLFGGLVLARGAAGLAWAFGRPGWAAGLHRFGLNAPLPGAFFFAATGGNPDVALGLAAGGIVAPVLAVTGVCALLAPPLGGKMRRGDLSLAAAVLAYAVLCRDGAFTAGDAGIVLAALLLRHLLLRMELSGAAPSAPAAKPCGGWCSLAYLFIALAALGTGCTLLIDGILNLAAALAKPPAAISPALALIACLPLLADAARRAGREGRPGVGAAFSYAAFPLWAAALLGMSLSLPVPPLLAGRQVWMLGLPLLVLAAFAAAGSMGRGRGAVYLALYGAFIVWSWG